MDDIKNRKEKLMEIIKESGQLLDSEIAKKLNFSQIEQISRRLIQFSDDCEECQNYIDLIIQYAEDTDKFSKPWTKQEVLDFKRDIKVIVSHMHSKHKLLAEGHNISIYLPLGLAMGAALGTAFNNIAIGISLGLCLGVAIGSALDADSSKKGNVL